MRGGSVYGTAPRTNDEGGSYGDYERYRRLACMELPHWRYADTLGQVASWRLTLEEGVVARIDEFEERVARLNGVRHKLLEQFESEHGETLWKSYTAWTHAHQYGTIEERLCAQQQWYPMTKRLNDFTTPNIARWNEAAEQINSIRGLGNPIPDDRRGHRRSLLHRFQASMPVLWGRARWRFGRADAK